LVHFGVFTNLLKNGHPTIWVSGFKYHKEGGEILYYGSDP
jgi:hypothetical protein